MAFKPPAPISMSIHRLKWVFWRLEVVLGGCGVKVSLRLVVSFFGGKGGFLIS